MAVTEVSKLFTDRGAKDDIQNHRTYTRMYEVLTDDSEDDEQVVGNASVDGVSVPIPGDALDSDPGAICVSVDFRQSDDSPMIWYVTAEYDSDPVTATGGGSGGGSGPDRPDNKLDTDGNPIEKGERKQNPLDEPAQWSLAFESRDEPVTECIYVDAAGNLVLPIPGNWTTSTVYTRGVYVRNGNNVYFLQNAIGLAVSGTGAGPAGNGTGIADSPVAWAGSTAYSPGDYVTNGGNVYKCKTGGMSAGAGGPAGTDANDITDGSVVWNFVGLPAVWAFYAPFVKTQNDPNYAIPRALLNSGKLPFDPGVLDRICNIQLQITKNMPLVGLDYPLTVQQAINRDTWNGIPPRCALIREVAIDGGKELNGIQYVTGKWTIALDKDTWDVRILDAGFGYLDKRTDPATGQVVTKYKRFTDVNGQPLEHPIPLNGAGQPLDPDAPPVFIRFMSKRQQFIDFNRVLPF